MANLGKLQTNIPRTGTLSAVYFAKSTKAGYGDQIKLVGSWEREGEGQFWLPLPAIDAFTDAGLVQYAGDKNGEPTWRVLYPTQRICVVRREEGRKKITEVFPVNDQGQQLPPLVGQPRSTLPPATPAAASATPATAAPAGPAAAAAAPAPSVAPAAAPAATPAPAAPSPEQRREQMRQRWAELDERYGAAVAIAAYRLREAGIVPRESDLTDNPAWGQIIQSGAATVLIESNKLNLSAPPGLAKALRERANGHGKRGAPEPQAPERVPARAGAGPGGYEDEFPEGLDEEDDDLPF